MNTNICPVKKQKQFECKNCNFICSKSSNYNSHLLTAKHLLAINSENPVNDTNITTNANIENKIFTCKCARSFGGSSKHSGTSALAVIFSFIAMSASMHRMNRKYRK